VPADDPATATATATAIVKWDPSACVSVGSSLDSLNAAYPAGFAQSVHGQNGADVYAVGDASGMIAFDVSAPYPDDPSGWPAGDLDKVIAMNVFVPRPGVAIVPNFGTSNRGFCPD